MFQGARGLRPQTRNLGSLNDAGSIRFLAGLAALPPGQGSPVSQREPCAVVMEPFGERLLHLLVLSSLQRVEAALPQACVAH